MSVQVVDVAKAREASYRIAKVGTSGYDDLASWLAKANEAQLDAMNLLSPHYGKLTDVDDLLAPFVKEATCSFTSGVLTFPTDYYGIKSMWKTVNSDTIDVPNIKTSMIGPIFEDTVRKPTVDKPKRYIRNGSIILLPSNGDAGTSMIYLRKPNDVSITTTPVADAGDDYETVTAKTDFEWPYRAQNLLIYLIVQRLGVEMKQPILYEIAQLGIKINMTVEKPTAR